MGVPDEPTEGPGTLPMRRISDPLEGWQALGRLRASLFGREETRLKLGRYVLLDPVGQGGAGVVFRARDPEMNREVAIKLLQAGSGRDAKHHERLQREAQALARLSHPNVVKVFDVGSYDRIAPDNSDPDHDPTTAIAEDGLFMVMELVQGVSLVQWMAGERTWPEVLAVFRSAGNGLAAAHRHGLLHRDFKPANVLLGDDGRVRVLDFGLAREHGASSSSDAELAESFRSPDDPGSRSTPFAQPLTATGTVMGTPAYMAPEQHRGDALDARTDQFSFCVALYEALYGQRPYPQRDLRVLATAKEEEQVRDPPSDADVPAWIHKVVVRGLSVDPGQRFPTMEDLLAALGRVGTRAQWPWVAGIGALALLGGAAAWTAGSEQTHVCADGGVKLADTWSAADRATLRATFERAELEYGEVVERVDDYVEAWSATHRDACQDATSGTDFDLRMACLNRRFVELKVLLEVIDQADVAAVRLAPQAVARLTPPAPCSDAAALRADAPAPHDRETAAAAAAIRVRVSRSSALREAGRYDAALAEASAALADARALDYGPVLAEALRAVGLHRDRAGDIAGAENSLTEAVWVAKESRHDAFSVRAMGSLISVLSRERDRLREAVDWAKHAEAVLQRVGRGGRVEAELYRSLGALAGVKGRYAEAERYYQRSLANWKIEPTASDWDLASTNNALGNAAAELGHHQESQQRYERAVALYEKVLGPRHPDVAMGLSNLGLSHYEQGNYEQARRHLERALSLRDRVLGPKHPEVASSLLNLGIVLASFDDQEGARQHYLRSDVIWEQSFGARHRYRAMVQLNLAMSYAAEGDHEAALAHGLQALTLIEAALGGAHPDVGRTLTAVGQALIELDRLSEAELVLERSVAILERSEADAVLLAAARFALAHPLWASGQRERARALVDRSARAYEHAGERAAESLRQVRAWQAQND